MKEDTPQRLTELKATHSRLLQANASNAVSEAEMEEFIHTAAAAGAGIASESARDGAQSLLDYWTGTLLSKNPPLAARLSGVQLAPYTGPTSEEAANLESVGPQLSESERKARATEAYLQRAEAVTAQLSTNPLGLLEKNTGLRRALLPLFKLAPGSRVPLPYPFRSNHFATLDPETQNALGKLIDAGVVVKEGTEPTAAYHLADPELLTRWETLRLIVEERRGFRDLASGWKKGGQHDAALLSRSSQLELANDYIELSETERLFLDASRKQALKKRRHWLWAILFVALMLAALLLQALLSLKNSRNHNSELKKANDDLAAKNEQLEQLASRLKKTTEEREQQIAELNTYQSKISSLSELGRQMEQDATAEGRRLKIEQMRNILRSPNKPVGTGASDTSTTMAEIFVSVESPKEALAATKYVQALQTAGIRIPAGIPLPRSKVAATTEIRYFRAEDKPHAVKVLEALKVAGFPATILEPKLIEDATAPKAFIQISIAKNTLVKSGEY